MSGPRTNSRRVRLSPLDVATGIVLLLAVMLFVRPGSAVYVGVTQRVESRRFERNVADNWDALASVIHCC